MWMMHQKYRHTCGRETRILRCSALPACTACYIYFVRAAFVLIFFLSVPCFAQRYIKIGLSIPQTTATAPYGTIEQALPGFLGGIAFSRQWSEKIAIRPEVLFIQKGFRFTSSTEQLRIRLNYIELPLMGVLTVSRRERPVMIFLEAGPSLGYGLGGKYE